MKNRQNRILRNTFTASLAVYVLSSITTAVGTMVDGVIIGQFLGVDSIAAFGIVSPIMIAGGGGYFRRRQSALYSACRSGQG